MRLAERIEASRPEPGSIAIFWLAQAGFVLKNAGGKIVYLDPYLSDVVEREFGFPRMIPAPIAAEEVRADIVLCTHEHLDHMDTGALPVIARDKHTVFAGPVECLREFEKLGIAPGQCRLLERGKTAEIGGVRVTGVYADHGDYAPDALGLIVEMDGIRIYHTGDTAYRPDEMREAALMRPDVLIPCINGAFGNMNAQDAAMLARDCGSGLVIASHFWMFVQHGGDPAAFLAECGKLAPQSKAIVMQPGGMCTVERVQAAAAER